jgi:DNA-binding MarR family transcriptional regulator
MTNPSPADNAASKAEPAAALLKLENFLPHQLNVLSSLVSQALTQVYGKHGIGIPEWRVLVSLGQFGVMTGKAIGERTHMHKTKVSRAVAQLEQRKFVTRRANRADLREAFLSLTPSGRAVYEELAPRALDFTRKLSEVVNAADRAAFDRAVAQLTARSGELVLQGERKGSER